MLMAGEVLVFLRFNTITENEAGFVLGDAFNYGGGIALWHVTGRLTFSGNIIAGNDFFALRNEVSNAIGTAGKDCLIEGLAPVPPGDFTGGAATFDGFGNLFGTVGESTDPPGRIALLDAPSGRVVPVHDCVPLARDSLAGSDDDPIDAQLRYVRPDVEMTPFMTPFYFSSNPVVDDHPFLFGGDHPCLLDDQRGVARPGALRGDCDIGSIGG